MKPSDFQTEKYYETEEWLVKKVVALQGSPRKNGNTELLMQQVVQEAEKLGAKTEVFYLNGLNMKGCQACFACKTNPLCVMKDDASKILEAIAAADAVILATPVYMWDMTAQLKLLVDRLFCFLNPNYSSKLSPGKKVLWTITQGNPDEKGFMAAFEKHGKMLQFLGFGQNQFLLAGGLRTPGEISARAEVLQKARDLAGWLVADPK